jgi:hypothetical protein
LFRFCINLLTIYLAFSQKTIHKMKNQYTKNQIKQLCQALIHKSMAVYADSGIKFDSKLTTPKHYDILAKAINKHNAASLTTKVKDTWLFSLFKRSREDNEHKVESQYMDACCRYASGNNALAYFEETNSHSIENYYGIYQIYWKGNTRNSEKLPYKHAFNIEIATDKTAFWAENEAKPSVYVGHSTLINNNLYIELAHPKQKEKVYMMLHVGISDNLDYLSVIYAGVDNKPRPASAIMLFVRQGVVLNTDLLDEYFYTRYAQNALIRAKDSVDMHSMQSNLIVKTPTELKKTTDEKLSNVFGNWYLYTKSREAGCIHRGKLSIKNLTEMYLKSTKNEYSEGKLELKGSTIVLQFHNDKCFTVFILNVGHGSIIQLQTEHVLVSTTGVDQPFNGIGILERIEADYNQMNAALISQTNEAEAYNRLKELGIIDKLNKKDNLYL